MSLVSERFEERVWEIAEFYGIPTELRQLSEECCELGAEASKCFRKGFKPTSNLVSEIADVAIVASEIMHLFGISQEQLDTEIDYKIGRQLGRIKFELAQSRNQDGEDVL